MSHFWIFTIGLLVGMVIGSLGGLVIAALCVAAGKADEESGYE